ncbi:MAG TPA: hypothetical protein VFA70_09665, partial [Dehalococcoidia bacterium]|nr:hypothetical protein [Dehalococcoidia bacterium]
MSVQAVLDEITEEGGVLIGPYRAPTNLAMGAGEGSIHDDATAQRLGFRGGTVAGSVHMQQFPPVLLRAFGQRWFETGALSCYFRNATMHGEPVRPFLRLPAPGDDVQTDLWMERDTGIKVLDGTASIGRPAELSIVEQRIEQPLPRGETRILAHLEPGLQTDAYPTRFDSARMARSLAVLTEPLDWYTGPSPWGGPIVNPGIAVGPMRVPEAAFRLRENRAVGLFGAIEIRHLNGPIFVDRDYTCSGELLAVGETPQSEYVWYRTTLHDGGTDVAQMI